MANYNVPLLSSCGRCDGWSWMFAQDVQRLENSCGSLVLGILTGRALSCRKHFATAYSTRVSHSTLLEIHKIFSGPCDMYRWFTVTLCITWFQDTKRAQNSPLISGYSVSTVTHHIDRNCQYNVGTECLFKLLKQPALFPICCGLENKDACLSGTYVKISVAARTVSSTESFHV